MRHLKWIYYKVRHDMIYYKLRQVLQSAMIYITKCDVSTQAFDNECCECTIKQICSKFLEGKSLLMSYALSLEL